jgi:hypothetical protein
MRAIKAVIEDGKMILETPLCARGHLSAILLLLDAQPWDAVAYDSDACPEPARASREALEEFGDDSQAAVEAENVS